MKYFVVSDVHSFYDEMMLALHSMGFDENNPQHIIISCGDLLDRGNKPKECIDFFMSRPNDILIYGNHEELLVKMLKRGYSKGYDGRNGTLGTVINLCDSLDKDASNEDIYKYAYKYVKPYIKRTVDYFETEHYVFVHGWIPFCDEWRNGSWEEARWENGMLNAHNGIIVPGKTVVCGHYHTSWGHCALEDKCSEWGEDADFSPYYNEGIVAIDACTVFSGMVNCIVVED